MADDDQGPFLRGGGLLPDEAVDRCEPLEAMNDLREILRLAQRREEKPSAAILDGRVRLTVTLRSHLLTLTVTKESERAGPRIREPGSRR